MNSILFIPVILVGLLAVFIFYYPDMTHHDYCEGDYCYICVDRDDIPPGFSPDREISYDAGCGAMEHAVRYDRP